MNANKATDRHLRRFFSGHVVTTRQWKPGPAKDALPNLHVLEIAPGRRLTRWTFVTVGAWEANPAHPLEFLVIGDSARPAYVELLTMVAFYACEHNLGLGHTIPIGQPLIEGSACEHVYLSLPYTYGPELQVVRAKPKDHHILWLFPITSSEKNLLLRSGMDALEDRLEAQKVEYWSPFRASVA